MMRLTSGFAVSGADHQFFRNRPRSYVEVLGNGYGTVVGQRDPRLVLCVDG
jgi:hypothetical protein